MKNNFDLSLVLEEVAKGKTPINKAKSIIESHFSTQSPKLFGVKDKNKDKLKLALDKIKKTICFDDVLKISTQFVQQISENVPQKIQENFAPNIGFSPKIKGIDSKLSVFRGVNVTAQNTLENNLVVGCQWFGVNFIENCHVKENKFTAIQLTEFSLRQTDLCHCQFSISRMSHVTLQEACFLENKFSLSTWSDVSVTESDFTHNKLSRCDFLGTVMNSSRFSKLNFSNVNFKDCEFDSCDIQGIEFDNCEFKDCSFHQIHAVSEVTVKISGKRLVGKQFSQCQSVREFVDLLNQP